MNRRIVAGMIVPALGLASTVAILTGDREAISLQIWLAAFVVGVSVAALSRLRDTSPFAPAKPGAIYTRNRSTGTGPGRDRRLRILEGLILRSRDSDRAFKQQLQPQLVTLATHFLRVNHGVNIDRDPANGARVLGELNWLIEEPPGGRTPTVAELDRFVDLLTTTSSDAGPA